MSHDPYVNPATGVLRNRYGLEDGHVLQSLETDIVAAQDTLLKSMPLPGLYDLDHLCAFHKFLFGSIYDWAGSIRTVSISKGGMPFCRVEFIHTMAPEIFPPVSKHNHLRNLGKAAAVAAMAELLGELNALHPFRDGNGRTQRAFLRQWASTAGWVIDWTGLDQGANRMASIAAMGGNCSPLEDLLDAIVKPQQGPE